jgi:hypothetical protein
MLLNDKQSIILTGLLAGGLFIFGILDILENFLVLTILTVIFIVIVFNLLYVHVLIRKEHDKKNVQ